MRAIIKPESTMNAMYRRICNAMAILDVMDDNITEHGGDEDPGGKQDLKRIRRAKYHLHKALCKALEAQPWRKQ